MTADDLESMLTEPFVPYIERIGMVRPGGDSWHDPD